jgi:hypothetical protein
MTIKYSNIPIQGPPKFTQLGIFGSKTNHLATLQGMTWRVCRMTKAIILIDNQL